MSYSNSELVKIVAAGDVIYLVRYQNTYMKLQPAFGGHYEEEISHSEYKRMKKEYTVDQTVPMGLFGDSSKIKDTVKRQLGLLNFEETED
jgi:hypothetical protein